MVRVQEQEVTHRATASRLQPDSYLGQNPVRIKVVGVGGGGCNCIRRMSHRPIPGVELIMVNTDVKSLELEARGATAIQIGQNLTQGWGAGGNPDVGKMAVQESAVMLRKFISDSELVFITAGMGGGTGTGAVPLVARMAKGLGALVIGVVTTPFGFEGGRRLDQAIGGVAELRPFVDNLIVVQNDRLLHYVNNDASIIEAFRTADDVVSQGILSLSELINIPSEINVDFSEVKRVLSYPGGALMSIGTGKGNMAALDAGRKAIANPLLNMSIKGARGVLFNVRGGKALTLGGLNAVGELIVKYVKKDATIFFGMNTDFGMDDDVVELTLIATGLKQGGFFKSMANRKKVSRPT